MVGIVIASHGKFAEGIYMSGSMIFGDQADVKAVTLMPSEGPDDIRKKMEDAIKSFSQQDEILFLIDLWSGTPFNQASGLIDGHEGHWVVVTGLNLPMLIESYALRLGTESAAEIASHVAKTSKEGIRILPETIKVEGEDEAAKPAAPAQPQGAIPEGTVIGDGKIKYVLARIDTRLLHGQVATAWTKAKQPTRIIAVSDNVAKDALRKQMIEQAAPPGVHAHVVPIDKMCKVDKDTRFGNTKAMLLFENPTDALRAVKGGVSIKEINLGSIAASEGKVVVSKAVAMGKEDVEAIEELRKLGVKVYVQKVPSDPVEDLDAMLKKAKSELGM
jgi:PTS system mannose-specific IIB component